MKEKIMKVLISSGFLGGAGGAERALFSILNALAADEVDVVIRHRLEGHLAAVGVGVQVSCIRDWRWRRVARQTGLSGCLMQRAINTLRRWLLPEYNVDLHFLSGTNLTPTMRALERLIEVIR